MAALSRIRLTIQRRPSLKAPNNSLQRARSYARSLEIPKSAGASGTVTTLGSAWGLNIAAHFTTRIPVKAPHGRPLQRASSAAPWRGCVASTLRRGRAVAWYAWKWVTDGRYRPVWRARERRNGLVVHRLGWWPRQVDRALRPDLDCRQVKRIPLVAPGGISSSETDKYRMYYEFPENESQPLRMGLASGELSEGLIGESGGA